mgnify:CR=1 FL=1
MLFSFNSCYFYYILKRENLVFYDFFTKIIIILRNSLFKSYAILTKFTFFLASTL